MKKFGRIACLSFLLLLFCNIHAWSIEERQILSKNTAVTFTSFLDYPPFSSNGERPGEFITIFQPFFDGFSEAHDFRSHYDNYGTYDDLILKTVRGEIDIILGAYFESERYNGIDIIFPALIVNPVSLVTMPDNGLQIKSKADLKNLKGAIDSREHFSDYVKNDFENYNIESFDTSEKLYEQLFIGNVDYILTSRYYGAIEQAKLGIRNMVRMSKNSLWDMPLFVGTSAIKPRGKKIAKMIRDYLSVNKTAIKQKVEKALIEEIRKADEAAIGVVPPAYVK